MSDKQPKMKRINFFNPITKKNQILKLKKSIIEEIEHFPFPVSTQFDDKILTLYIDKNLAIRGSDISTFYPSLLNPNKQDFSITNTDEKDAEKEAQFKVFKSKVIEEQQSMNTYGNVLLVGLSKAGKSSIVNRLKANLYNPQIRPTLGTSIIKVFMEEMNFRIFDMGGQEKLREKWYQSIQQFEAIIFVLDVVQDENGWKETAKEFKKIHNYYFDEIGMGSQTPLIIFGNKIDLIAEGEKTRKRIMQTILEKLELSSLPTNYHVELSSALENKGILPNFKWLVKNYIKIKQEL